MFSADDSFQDKGERGDNIAIIKKNEMTDMNSINVSSYCYINLCK